jgi:hypothetical protein
VALTPERALYLKSLVASGYLPTLEKWAKKATAPIWWVDPSGGAPSGMCGGTVCFVNTGRRLIGITAEHVHREIVERRAANPEVWCQVGAHTFDPESRIIDADRQLDIATYDFTAITANAAGVDVHHARTWPPLAVDGALGIVGGWPWMLSTNQPNSVTHKFLHIICQLQVNQPDQIGAATFTSASIPWGPEALPPGTNLGGMSGGPIYQLVPEPIEHLQLVGTVFEYHTAFELILARPLRCVQANGTVERGAPDV